VSRFVVYGAGAVGGVIGSRLFESGREVVLIARGAHRDAIARAGLRVESPEGVVTSPVRALAEPAALDWREDDVVLLTMKGQDTAAALGALEAAAPRSIAVVCAQNGVENERLALRRFAEVHSVVVQLPATHLEAGVVLAHSAPVPGCLDIGSYPDGPPTSAEEIAAALRDAGFVSQAREDISRWKYAKLLRNLANSVQALFGTLGEEVAEIMALARAEADAAFAAAGIDYVPDEKYDARHDRLITPMPVPGRDHGGGSSWQSLARGRGTIEANELNGEIVLLGRLHAVATAVNERLRVEALAAARCGERPGGRDPQRFLALLRAAR
jgi:2-dehydropantoate 2-reductase